ncbi:hypothetical protein ACFVEN_21430 [Streptomyces sp. NPDC057681]|uniref:hypothetical protein n=1 Tax=Streptomyces sp. NPDC057681 TaxID=3346209 RepID=UPI0036C34652
MSDSNTLKSQYSAQVEADLERNAKEQERVAAELAALQEQLQTLDHDRTLLVGMRETLSSRSAASVAEEAPVAPKAEPPVGLPKARKPKGESAAPKQRAKKEAGKKPAAKKAPTAAQARTPGSPTLRELVLNLITTSTEPRSAAEVTTTLAESHPERKAGGTVVRNTLESLVARGQAERTKQNKSVFYTALPAAAATTEDTDKKDAPANV